MTPPGTTNDGWLIELATEVTDDGRATDDGRVRRAARSVWKLLGLLGLLIRAAMSAPGKGSPAATRAAWLQRWSQRLLALLEVRIRVDGVPASRGLLVANHLGYLDVLVLAAVQPAIFVAKEEVGRWPVVGRLTHGAGSLSLDRSRRGDVARVNTGLATALAGGSLVVIFPEGTSSDGRSVLPFWSSLLQPAIEQGAPVIPAALSYALPGGSVADEVCYWRDMTFAAHVLNLLGRRGVRVRVSYGCAEAPGNNRKELARTLRNRVVALRRPA